MNMQKGDQMTTEQNPTQHKHQNYKMTHTTGASEAVYGLGLIGAWIYYISHAATFWLGVLGILKGIVWPAMLVYEMLKFFNM
jgi:hypothetical protein